jgi:hypothetical protein
MKVKKLIAAVAVFGTGFAVFSTGATVQAEPVSNSYTVVGSDTLEDVLNALVNGTAITGATVRVTQNGATLGSFDATGGPSIITRTGGVRFSRPNGSSEGFQALSASISADPATQIFTSGTYQPVGVASVSKTAQPNYWMAKSLRNINIFVCFTHKKQKKQKTHSQKTFPEVSDQIGLKGLIKWFRFNKIKRRCY